jgi:uncharacterized protein YndB with AHSA1/START domain
MTSTESGGVLGSLRSEGSDGVIRMEARLDATVDTVWAALTEPRRLAKWYGDVTGDLRVGGEYKVHVHMSGWEGTGRIEVCEAPHRLVIFGKEPDDPSEQSDEITLEATGNGTLFVAEQRGIPRDLIAAFAAGAQLHVEDLAKYLAGNDRVEPGSRFDELHEVYKPQAANLNP